MEATAGSLTSGLDKSQEFATRHLFAVPTRGGGSPPRQVRIERAEDFDAEEPELAEQDGKRGRLKVAELEGILPLVKLLDSTSAPVLTGAGNALYNLTLQAENAETLLQLQGMPKVTKHLAHLDPVVQASMAGVLMNSLASSVTVRDSLAATGLMGQLLPVLERSCDMEEPEVRKNALGALNNLLLDRSAALSLRAAGGLSVLSRLLRDAVENESILEDTASSLLRVVQEDEGA